MSRWWIGALLAPLTFTAYAQPSLGGPVSGFVYDPASRAVRPLLGVRGATRMGPPAFDQTDWASVAPGGSLAITRQDGHAVLRAVAGGSAAPVTSDPLLDSADLVAWSRSGDFAVLSSSSAASIQRLRSAGGAVYADPAQPLPATGAVTALAIDAAGDNIAVAIDHAGLYLIHRGSAALLSSTAQAAAAAFDASGRLYVADLATNRILDFTLTSGEGVFASLEDGVSATGLAFSANGHYLLLTDRAGRAVRIYETASRELVNTLPLDFAPTCLERLSADGLFVLNGDNPDEWLLVLDARDTPQVYFVPAGSEDRL